MLTRDGQKVLEDGLGTAFAIRMGIGRLGRYGRDMETKTIGR